MLAGATLVIVACGASHEATGGPADAASATDAEHDPPVDGGGAPSRDAQTGTDTGKDPAAKRYVAGVTVTDIGPLASIVDALARLPRRATARVVFDEGQSPAYYAPAISAIHAKADVMGELLDSLYVRSLSVAQYAQRARDYLAALSTTVDIWEVGNEINGDWVGPPAEVSAKMAAAYDVVTAANKRAALTLYACDDGAPENRMLDWASANVPARMRSGLSYVWVSYYEGDCGAPRSDWQSVFDQLHALFPSALLGFGETGTVDAQSNHVGNPTVVAPYLQKYYTLRVTTPNFVGGYFWWFFVEDMVPATKPLFTNLGALVGALP